MDGPGWHERARTRLAVEGHHPEEPPTGEIATIGLDLAKHVFQVHAVSARGEVVLRRQLRRGEVLRFFARQPACLVGMEACGGAHHWAREIAALGHTVRMMPPAYVKPYVERGKTDAADGEAICKAVTRPTMRFVPAKMLEQQSILMLHKTRELLIKQRTMLINGKRSVEARLPARAVNVLGRPGAGSFGLTLWSTLMTTRRVAGIAGSRS